MYIRSKNTVTLLSLILQNLNLLVLYDSNTPSRHRHSYTVQLQYRQKQDTVKQTESLACK